MYQLKNFVLTSIILLITGMGMLKADTTFTYQGELKENGNLATGSFNLDFRLWDAANAGNQIGPVQSISNVAINEGKFAVQLDFGSGAFNGARWLEIVVDGTLLSPRTPITAAPVASQLHGTTVDPVTGFIGINHDTHTGPRWSWRHGCLRRRDWGRERRSLTQLHLRPGVGVEIIGPSLRCVGTARANSAAKQNP